MPFPVFHHLTEKTPYWEVFKNLLHCNRSISRSDRQKSIIAIRVIAGITPVPMKQEQEEKHQPAQSQGNVQAALCPVNPSTHLPWWSGDWTFICGGATTT